MSRDNNPFPVPSRGHRSGGVLQWCRTRDDGTNLSAPKDRRTNDSPQEAGAGGRREGDILLHVLPKSQGQQYRVRGDVRARLTRGLEAPLITGLLPDARLRLHAN